MEKMQCLRHETQLPPNYWGELLLTATYLRNLSPSSNSKTITPVEEWTGKRPDLSHLRIIGSIGLGGARRFASGDCKKKLIY
jgi:hypothetical protein